ncbi:MAG: hypothetical protein OXH61_08750 [Acidimicrobiaceae bacterium]|nr:hypothetical protein [Acidimicrobiaceae bacterium]
MTDESSEAEQIDPDSGADSADSGAQGQSRWVSPGSVSLQGAMREAMQAPPTVFEAVGGQRFFDELVGRFYDAVEHDPLLRPMYPANMGPSRERLAGFLAQYWGGPAHYSEKRGHPRLRMRHMPFVIGSEERDAWMKHMEASLRVATLADGTDGPLPTEIRDAMFDHFDNAATHLVNHPRE